VPDIVSSTDLPQPKVNKCLIALVGKKAAIKLNAGVSPFLFVRSRLTEGVLE
jgi:hypothetical protein